MDIHEIAGLELRQVIKDLDAATVQDILAYGLGVAYSRHRTGQPCFIWHISSGGPGDAFWYYLDRRGRMERVIYRYENFTGYVHVPLTGLALLVSTRCFTCLAAAGKMRQAYMHWVDCQGKDFINDKRMPCHGRL